MNIGRPRTPGNLWRIGSGAPAAGLGGDGEIYYDRTTGRHWEKTAGAWGLLVRASQDLTLLWDSVDAGVTLPAGGITTPTLPNTYKNFLIEYVVRNTAGSNPFAMRFNGDGSGNYYWNNIQAANTVISAQNVSPATYAYLGLSGTAESCGGAARIFNVGGSAFEKNFIAQSQCQNDGSATHKIWTIGGIWNSGAAISTITFYFEAAGNISAGSRITVYGEA